jgi:hypothetical protein
MHKIDIDNDPQWHAKLKENRAEAQRDPRVQAVQTWANENYERGADTIVEAFEPDEILELVAKCDTPDDAIRCAAEYCGLRRSVENDVRGYGDLAPLPQIIVVDAPEISPCCGAYTSVDENAVVYCKQCYHAV